LFICLLLSNFSALAQKTNIWIVRHAEKATTNPKDDDPVLSAIGQKRAEDLAKELKGAHIKAIYVTKYKRTGQPQGPWLLRTKFYPGCIMRYHLVKSLPKLITKNFLGNNVLIIGHSNTIMPLLNAFGAEMPFAGLDDRRLRYAI
jgi:2,3-bisphosphoglycerate-dependent phosphoglycerate mutase